MFPKVQHHARFYELFTSFNRSCKATVYTLSSLQGGWETDESVQVAAMRETVEEAGVRGKLEVLCLPLRLILTSLSLSPT